MNILEKSVSGKLQSAFCIAALAAAMPASAQEWNAVTLETPAYSDVAPSAAASIAARGVGISQALVDADAPGIAAALSSLSQVPNAVIYFSGPLALGLDGEILLGSGSGAPVFASQLSLDAIATRLAAGATRQLVVLLEDCAGRDSGAPGLLAGLSLLPEPPVEILLASAAGPGGLCAPGRPSLAARLDASATPLSSFEDFEAALTGASLLRLAATTDRPAPTAPTDDFGPMTLALGAAEPDDFASVPDNQDAATDVPGPGTAVPAGSGRAQVVRVGLRPDDPIIKTRSGGRRPSILIGIRPQELEALTAPTAPEAPPEPELPLAPVFDDRIARDTLRSADPLGFATLLAAGAIDPPDTTRVAYALQGELKGMACYSGGLDNDWGPGSKRALEAYARERGVVAAAIAPDLEATVELWREIIGSDPVTCPQVVTAAPTPKPTAKKTTAKKTTTKVRKPAPAKAPAPVKKAPPKKKISNSNFGNFR